MVEMLAYDYKGQPKSKSRQVIKDGLVVGAMPTIYRVDWIPGGTGQECTNEGALLEGDYVTDIEYDALGRPTSITLPADVSTGRKIVEPTYNRAGAMESISLDSTVYVSRLAYPDSRDQRAKDSRQLREWADDTFCLRSGELQAAAAKNRGLHAIHFDLYPKLRLHKIRLRLRL